MPLTTILFDLDGTLLDTSQDLGTALNYVRQAAGLDALCLDTIRPHVSNGSHGLITYGFGEELDSDTYQHYRQSLLSYYLENISTYTKPFDGIETLISNIAQNSLQWGIVTNKPLEYTAPLMQHFTFASDPAIVVCPDHVKKSKPAPDGLLYACQYLSSKPEQTLYIGDHERDIRSGENAVCKTLAVGYGFTEHPKEHLQWRADHAADTAEQIWPIIQYYNDKK